MIKLDIFTHQDLQALNTLAVPAVAGNYLAVKSKEQLLQALKLADELSLPVLILGGGSNIILPEMYPGLVIHMQITGIDVRDEDEEFIWVEAGAGESWPEFVEHCLHFHFWGLENLSLIPGTVGAAPIQNIGAYGVELKDVMAELNAVDRRSGLDVTFETESCGFAYRDSVFKSALKEQYIITHVTFKLRKQPTLMLDYPVLKAATENLTAEELTPFRVSQIVCDIRRSKLPDPTIIPNAGSFFKNPIVSDETLAAMKTEYPDVISFEFAEGQHKVAAGWLLDKAGWKGRSEHGIGMHEQQALVLVNPGKRTSPHILEFAQKIQQDIQTRFGVALEIEPIRYTNPAR